MASFACTNVSAATRPSCDRSSKSALPMGRHPKVRDKQGQARISGLYALPARDATAAAPRTVFCARKNLGIHQAANFLQPAGLRLLPTRETLARQYARWRRRISLRDDAPGDRAYVATGGLHTFVRTQQRRRVFA